jgi:hypothetical protein
LIPRLSRPSAADTLRRERSFPTHIEASVNDNEINQEETMIPEARLERVASGLAPVSPG